MNDETRSNYLSGLFIVIVVAALVAMVMFLQNYEPVGDGKRFYIVFDEAPNIQVNSAVLVAGKRVGSVESIDIRQSEKATADGKRLKTEVAVAVRITPEFLDENKVFNNASADIETSVFGTSEVKLYPGGPGRDETSEVYELPDDAYINGQAPASMTSLMRQGEKVMSNVEAITARVNTMLSDETLEARIHDGFDRAIEALEEFTVVLHHLDATFDDAQPLVESARRTMENIESIVDENRLDIRQTMENIRTSSESASSLIGKLDGLADSLTQTSQDVSVLMQTSNDMLGENRGSISEMMANARDTSAYLRDMAEKLRRDPSIIVWGTDEDDNAADRDGGSRSALRDELALRGSGRLPPRERD